MKALQVLERDPARTYGEEMLRNAYMNVVGDALGGFAFVDVGGSTVLAKETLLEQLRMNYLIDAEEKVREWVEDPGVLAAVLTAPEEIKSVFPESDLRLEPYLGYAEDDGSLVIVIETDMEFDQAFDKFRALDRGLGDKIASVSHNQVLLDIRVLSEQ
jgi:hypothetical protein